MGQAGLTASLTSAGTHSAILGQPEKAVEVHNLALNSAATRLQRLRCTSKLDVTTSTCVAAARGKVCRAGPARTRAFRTGARAYAKLEQSRISNMMLGRPEETLAEASSARMMFRDLDLPAMEVESL